MFTDLFIILFSWLLLSLFSLASLPLVVLTIGKVLPDKGWAFTRIIGWLLVAVPIWFLAHVGLPVNTTPVIWLVLLGWLGLSAFLFSRFGQQIMPELQQAKMYILIEEGLFLFGLVFLSLVRGFAPDINGLEKFMDAGLIVSYLNSPTLPIKDMWLAGYTFNYYTFGHFLGAIASQVMRQPIEYSYNILLGFLMGLTLMQSFGLIIMLTVQKMAHKAVWIAGILGAFLVVFGGNTQHLWYLLTNHSFTGYWYPDATRFIPFTIHEFPAYSFIVSDLHAHVWDMVLVSLLLLFVWLWVRTFFISTQAVSQKAQKKGLSLAKPGLLVNQTLVMAVPVGFLLGIIASTSTWDTLIYGLFLAILGVLLLIYSRFKWFTSLIFSAIIIGISLAAAASPWWLTFDSISEGARIVTERTELWRFFTLWTGHMVVSAIALTVAIYIWRKYPVRAVQALFLIALIALAWILLILPELFYMKDIYPSHPRANTMFKLTFQAFIIMNLSAAWALGTLLQEATLKAVIRWTLIGILVIYSAIVLVYPYFGYRDYYNHLKGYKGLNGLLWLYQEAPTDYNALMWMRDNIPGKPNIAEAVGESYTTFARISAFSGFPTILGWRVHEWLWRGSFDIAGARTPDVETIFQQPMSYQAKQKLRQYGISYIFVGAKEREAYANLDVTGLKSLGDVVFEDGDTFIVKVE